MQNQIDNSKLELDGRKRLTLTNVQSVDGFTAQSLKLTVSGQRVIVVGENIKITAYNKGTGVMVAEGLFNEIKYCGESVPFMKKLFK